jgi:uncharacterized protein with HEPN domain
MPPDDRVRILHMIEAAETVAGFIADRDRSALDQDRMLLFALVRAIEIVGEAASKVSADTRLGAPAVPWGQITAMRNRLVHAYFDIDRDILWKTATVEVPVLLGLLTPLIAGPAV